MTESINSLLEEHRAKTYLCLLEHIRRLVMKRFYGRKQDCARWSSELPPTVNAKILKGSREGRLLKMLSAGNGEYELLRETRAYVTKLIQFSCECGVWQLSGVPCSHALVGIGHFSQVNTMSERVVDFVHPSLTRRAFMQTYAMMIHPIPDKCACLNIETPPLIPPPIKTLLWRPKVTRKREVDEKPRETRAVTMVCQKCGVAGHNNRTCNRPNKKIVTLLFVFYFYFF
ncbi:hypothetical protein ACOSQ3_002931 [Xanthoceras sorbifolium]